MNEWELIWRHNSAAQTRAIWRHLLSWLDSAEAAGTLGLPISDPVATRAIQTMRERMAAEEAHAAGQMFALRERIGRRPPRVQPN